jgi:hypothetical protein
LGTCRCYNSWRGLGRSFFSWGCWIKSVLCTWTLTATCYMRSSVEFSTCGIMLALRKFQILEHFRFPIFRLGMLNLCFKIKGMQWCWMSWNSIYMRQESKKLSIYLVF